MRTSRAGARRQYRQQATGRKKSSPGKSELEAAFLFHWRVMASDLPEPATQYIFHPTRKWRLDFAWPELKIGVEINGAGGGGYGNPVICHACGTRVRARLKNGGLGKELRMGDPSHSSAAGQSRDAEKQNALAIAGWRPLTFTSVMLRDDPGGCIEIIARLVRQVIVDNDLADIDGFDRMEY